VLRWTAAAITAGDAAVTASAGVATTLARRGLAPAGFVDGVRTFARTFFTMVGHVHRIDVESRRRGYRRRPGIAGARDPPWLAAGALAGCDAQPAPPDLWPH